MKFVKSNIPKWFGFSGIVIFFWCLVVPEQFHNKRLRNHEDIHYEQLKETLFIGFYIIYFILFLRYGYRNNPFEKEAYENEGNEWYILERKHYDWVHYF